MFRPSWADGSPGLFEPFLPERGAVSLRQNGGLSKAGRRRITRHLSVAGADATARLWGRQRRPSRCGGRPLPPSRPLARALPIVGDARPRGLCLARVRVGLAVAAADGPVLARADLGLGLAGPGGV